MIQPLLPGLLLSASPLLGPAPQDPPQRAQAPAAQQAPTAQDDQGGSRMDKLRERALSKLQEVPELRRADGTVILPGEVPEGTSVEARAAWKGLVDSLQQAKPMQSFQLAFYLRQANPDPDIRQVNDLNLNFSYLAPRYVRARLESDRTHLRGPRGDYLIDKQEVIRLVGRGAEQDIEQLDQMGAIASNFVALTQPVATLRLVKLELAPDPPRELHPDLVAEAKGLVWLSVVSPDLFLRLDLTKLTAGKPILYRAQLGIDPETRSVRLAVIHELNSQKPVPGSAMCVHMTDHQRRAGLSIPHTIHVFTIDPRTRPARFYENFSTRLTLDRKRGRLRAKLRPEDFLPPQ